MFAGNLFVAAEDDFLESLLEVVIECDVDHWVDHRMAVGEHVEPEPILLHQAGKLESLFISLLWRNLRQFNFQRKETLHYFALPWPFEKLTAPQAGGDDIDQMLNVAKALVFLWVNWCF